MNITNAIRRIAELSEIHDGNVEPGQVMYRFGIINGLATAALATKEETVAVRTDAAPPPEAPAPRPSKARYVRSGDIMDYVWSHEGSVRMEYLLRDLYHDRKGAEKLATTTLSRMKSLADITIDRDDNGKIAVITVRRMPKD